VLATVSIHMPMWARLSTHWVSGKSATVTILRAASRCSWPVRSTHPCGAREGAAPPRHSLASWRISSTCQCGRDVRRTGFASSPATVSIYVPTRVSPRPPRCDVVSCCLRPISLHAPMWARRQTCGARHIEFSTLSFVEQITRAAFFSVPCALVARLNLKSEAVYPVLHPFVLSLPASILLSHVLFGALSLLVRLIRPIHLRC
jgi:hypothetical protein